MQTNGDPFATDTSTDTRYVRHLNRLTVAEAADRLGITQDAVRQRIRRDTIRHDKDENGRVYVYLDSTNTDHDSVRDTVHDGVRDELVEELRDRVRSLEEANRENRRLLAAAFERIPAIEAPQEPREDHETRSEPVGEDRDRGTGVEAQTGVQRSWRRSWWRRWLFGG